MAMLQSRYLKAGPLDHPLHNPVHGGVLFPDMIQNASGKLRASLLGCLRYEFLEEFFLISGVKGVDHIPEAELSSLFEHIEYTQQCDLFPEVGEMVQCDLGHYSVQRSALVLIGEKSPRQELDIAYSPQYCFFLSVPQHTLR